MSADTDLIPLLACADIAAEHDFLVEVLGFTSAGWWIATPTAAPSLLE
jgi:hypothetical protein